LKKHEHIYTQTFHSLTLFYWLAKQQRLHQNQWVPSYKDLCLRVLCAIDRFFTVRRVTGAVPSQLFRLVFASSSFVFVSIISNCGRRDAAAVLLQSD
jgi:hypothetical protein